MSNRVVILCRRSCFWGKALGAVGILVLILVLNVTLASGQANDFKADARLAKRVTIALPDTTVVQLLTEIGRQTGVALTVSTTEAAEKASVFARHEPAEELLRLIALVTKTEWEVVTPSAGGPPAYRLVRTEVQKSRDASEQRKWREGRERLAEARKEVALDLISGLMRLKELSPEERTAALDENPFLKLAAEDPQAKSLASYLAGLPPEQIQSIAEDAFQPLGVVSASQSTHLQRNMRSSTRLDSLPAGSRAGIESMARGQGASGDLSGATVGVVTYGGRVSLAVMDQGSTWTAREGISCPETPEEYHDTLRAARARNKNERYRSTDWNSAEARSALEAKYGISPSDDPRWFEARLSKQHSRLVASFADVRNRRVLSEFLVQMHRQTGVTIVSDGLMRSGTAQHRWTLGQDPRYELGTAAIELSRSFRKRIWTRGGCILFQSARPAIDRLFEVNEAQKSEFFRTKKQAGYLDFKALARMHTIFTSEQLETLNSEPTEKPGLQREAGFVLRNLPLFRFWNSLDNQRILEVQESGIALNKLSREQCREFWRLASRALPTSHAPTMRGGGIKIIPFKDSATVTIDRPNDTEVSLELRLSP